MRLESDLMRGAGPLAVLSLLSKGRMYGYELVEALSERSQGVLAMGQSTLYPMLYNLEAKGLISGDWQTTASGRERKYYSLTAKGRRRLEEQAAQWSRLSGAMAAILGLGGQGGGGSSGAVAGGGAA